MVPLLLLVGGILLALFTELDTLGYIVFGLGAALLLLQVVFAVFVGNKVRKQFKNFDRDFRNF